MNKKILQIGNPKLREVSELLSKDEILSSEISELKKDLIDTLASQKVGVGISAVQIGILKQVFLVNIKPNPNRPELVSTGPKFFFNPKIIKFSKENVEMTEGCLSISEAKLFGKVSRPHQITLSYQDEKGEGHTEEFDGFMCRVIQHEVDHINGKLFTDIVDLQSLTSDEEMRKNSK